MPQLSDFLEELSTPYVISDAQRRLFQEQGFIKLKQVLSPALLAFFNAAISEEVHRPVPPAPEDATPDKEAEIYKRAFNQVVKTFVFSRRLAGIAADLMGVTGVRLYHDQALYKLKNGGITPLHCDQYYWPLSTDHTCTVWVPMQATPMEMGPLSFSAGSHRHDFGRDLPIGSESQRRIAQALKDAALPHESTPFDLGEVSYHLGWTFHNATANTSGRDRNVMTVIYFEHGAKLAAPRNVNQEADWKHWLPGAVVGETIDTPLNPVLYHQGA
jgi:hypothetical protein